MANLSRAGKAPGSLGLSGTAGLQLKAPAKKYGLQKARPTASAFGRLEDDGEVDESVGQAAMRVGEGLRARAAATVGRRTTPPTLIATAIAIIMTCSR